MSKRKDRMSEIAFHAIPPVGSEEHNQLIKKLEKQRNGNAKLNKAIKSVAKKGAALISVQEVNGAGYQADSMLREYNLEYNGRVYGGTLHDMPGSFNVVEAFNSFIPPSATFKLRQESDHLFSLNEFIDYVTSSSFDDTNLSFLHDIKEGICHSYNSVSQPLDLTFPTNNGKEYCFSATSFIRFGNEISMLLVAGQICDLNKKTEEITNHVNQREMFSHRAHIKPSKELKALATPLELDSNLLKTLVLVRFDLETQTIDTRYIYEDWGNSYQGQTDDISAYIKSNGELIDPKLEDLVKNMSKKMDESQALFNLCKTCLFLPKYFIDNEESVSIQRVPTDFLEFRKKLKNRKILSLVEAEQKITYRDVYTLEGSERNYPDRSEFITPDFNVETTGFWKRLPVQSKGVGKNGQVVYGRTWVTQTLSWQEVETKSQALTAVRSKVKIDAANAGYIYVMRSAAHDKDIFKVGLTRRNSDVRARELSRSTSSPDQFLVVEDWYVKDCVLAEKLIHSRLSKYRVNPKREYFKTRYNVIFSAVDEVINELEQLN
tara:strand:+ start:500 stop:2140 length:1641 start_codon:yes stop_codon:yes gene_type:complete